MPKEVILCGFKVQVPLTPEDISRLKALWSGARALEAQLPRLSLLMSTDNKLAIESALRVFIEGIESVVSASDALAGSALGTRRS